MCRHTREGVGRPIAAKVCWFLCCATGLAALRLGSPTAGAATYDPANPADVWDLTTFNWDASSAPWTDGDAAIFGGSGEMVDVNAAVSTSGITFAVGGYTLADPGNNGSITFTGPTAILGSAGSNTISAAMILRTGNNNLTLSPGASLNLTGPISGADATSGVTLARTASGSLIWTISGNNTYGGGTLLSGPGGTLKIGSRTALGTGVVSEATSSFNIDNAYGAALTLGNDLAMASATGAQGLTFTLSNDLAFSKLVFSRPSSHNKTITVNADTLTVGGIELQPNGAGVVGLITAGTGTLAITGESFHAGTNLLGSTPAVTGGVTVGHKASLGTGTIDLRLVTFSASRDLAGADKITNALTTGASGQTTIFAGTNDIEFGGAFSANVAHRTMVNHMTGATLTFSGAQALSAGATATFTLLGTGDTVFTDALANSAGTASVVFAGTGSLLLQGAGTYNGESTFNNGTVTLDQDAGGSLSSQVLNLGGTFILKGAATGTSSQSFSTPTFNTTTTGVASGSTISINSNGGAGTTLTLGDTWVRASGATLHVDLSSANSALASNPTMTSDVVASIDAEVSTAYVTVRDGSGTGFATVSGGQVVRYTGASTLTTADPAGANVITRTDDPDYTGGTLTLAGPASMNTLHVDTSAGAGTLDLNGGTVTLGSRAVLATGDQDYTIQNGQLGLDATEVIIHQHSSGVLTISSQITGNTGSMIKAGSGTVVISGANTFTGVTGVNAGTLVVRDNNALGATAGLTAVSNGATLAIDGSTGSLVIGNETLRLMGNGAAGQSGALVNLGGTNTYGGQLQLFGGTTIASDSGTLNLTKTSVLTSTLAGGVPLTLAGEGNGAIAGAITASGITGVTTLTKTDGGTWTLSAANTFTGPTTITGGTLALSGAGKLASRSIIVGAASSQNVAKLDVSGTSSGGITLAAGQTLSGHGTVVGHVSGSAGSAIAPGADAGILTVQDGDFTLNSGALFIEVGKATPGSTPSAGSDYDQLAMTGTGTAADGTSKVDVTGGILMMTTNTGLEVGDILYIVSNTGEDAVVGTFAKHDGLNEALTEGASFTAGYYTFEITYAATADLSFTGGNDIALKATAVPEPASLGLLGVSIAGLLVRRRRRRVSPVGC